MGSTCRGAAAERMDCMVDRLGKALEAPGSQLREGTLARALLESGPRESTLEGWGD